MIKYLIVLLFVHFGVGEPHLHRREAIVTDGFFEVEDADNEIIIRWKFVQDKIQLFMEAPTDGWIAMGFNPDTDEMPGADIVWVAVSESGNGYILDRYATEFATPPADDHQDYALLGTNQANGTTSMLVERLLQTPDNIQDYNPIDSRPVYIIWAYGFEDTFDIHKNRGAFYVDLVAGEEIVEYTTGSDQIGSYSEENFAITWGWANSDKSAMWFTLTGLTLGWVGMGFQSIDSDEMPGADIYVFTFSGEGELTDRYATEFATPPMDEQQDGDLFDAFSVIPGSSASQRKRDVDQNTPGSVTFTWVRDLDTTDSFDRVIADEDITVIYALGFEPTFDVHYYRSSFQTNLFTGEIIDDLGDLQGQLGQFAKPDGTFAVAWGYSSKDKSGLWFIVQAETQGWVAVGFNSADEDGMPGADIYVLEVDESLDECTLTDRYATEFATPPMDEQQDGDVIAWDRTSRLTKAKFARDLDTQDSKDRVFKNEKITIIWAYGSELSFDVHVNRGSFSANLLTGEVFIENDWDSKEGQYYTDDDDFKIEWGFTDHGKTIVWKVKAHTEGWVGIGINNDRWMPDSDMIIISVGDEDEELVVVDRWATEYATPEIDEQQDVEGIYGYQKDGYTYAVFKRAVNTGDKQDRKISGGETKLLWAYGETDVFDIHVTKGVADINWYDDSEVSSNSDNPMRWVHALFMILSFGWLAVIGPSIARYLKIVLGNVKKKYGVWYYLHIAIMLNVTLFAIIGFIIIIIDTSNRDRTHFNGFHEVFGLILVIFVIFQPLWTLLLRIWGIDYLLHHFHYFHTTTNRFHKILGTFIVLGGLINIGTGLYKFDVPSYCWWVYGWLIGIIVLFWAMLEVARAMPYFEEFLGRRPGAPPAAEGEKAHLYGLDQTTPDNVKNYKLWSGKKPLSIFTFLLFILGWIIITCLAIALIVVVSTNDDYQVADGRSSIQYQINP